jgi:hypothetical protein
MMSIKRFDEPGVVGFIEGVMLLAYDAEEFNGKYGNT